MINVLFVGIGGFVGAALRYLLSLIPIHFTSFPLITLLINFAGAIILGILTEIPFLNGNKKLSLLLKTGVCGGFTTFSTFSLETFQSNQKEKIFYSIVLYNIKHSFMRVWYFSWKAVSKKIY